LDPGRSFLVAREISRLSGLASPAPGTMTDEKPLFARVRCGCLRHPRPSHSCEICVGDVHGGAGRAEETDILESWPNGVVGVLTKGRRGALLCRDLSDEFAGAGVLVLQPAGVSNGCEEEVEGQELHVYVDIFLLGDGEELVVVKPLCIAHCLAELQLTAQLSLPPVHGGDMTFATSQQHVHTVACVVDIVRAHAIQPQLESFLCRLNANLTLNLILSDFPAVFSSRISASFALTAASLYLFSSALKLPRSFRSWIPRVEILSPLPYCSCATRARLLISAASGSMGAVGPRAFVGATAFRKARAKIGCSLLIWLATFLLKSAFISAHSCLSKELKELHHFDLISLSFICSTSTRSTPRSCDISS
ncbi:BING4CT-domain-containing protein, partial [Aureobasidium melanogenum]